MSRPRCVDFAVTKDHGTMLYGMRLPKGALYGTYKGYSKEEPIKWIVTEFPQFLLDRFFIQIYSFPRREWIIAPRAKYRKLYTAVAKYIDDLDFIGHKVQYDLTRQLVFPSQAPYGRKQRAVGFKQANKTYLDRGSSGHKIYGDMKRNAAGEREYNFRSPNTIVYP